MSRRLIVINLIAVIFIILGIVYIYTFNNKKIEIANIEDNIVEVVGIQNEVIESIAEAECNLIIENVVDNNTVAQAITKETNQNVEVIVTKKETNTKVSSSIEAINENTSKKQEEIKIELPPEPPKEEYRYNETESQRLVNAVNILNTKVTAKISKTATRYNPFYPYRDTEVEKKVKNATFGIYIVYAQDYYTNGVFKQTEYHIGLE